MVSFCLPKQQQDVGGVVSLKAEAPDSSTITVTVIVASVRVCKYAPVQLCRAPPGCACPQPVLSLQSLFDPSAVGRW